MPRDQSLARNEALFRDLNERIGDILVGQGADGSERVPFACECPDLACSALVWLTLSEYAAVREHPRRFVVLAGHERDATERVVAATAAHVVVEKAGEAGEVTEDAADGA